MGDRTPLTSVSHPRYAQMGNQAPQHFQSFTEATATYPGEAQMQHPHAGWGTMHGQQQYNMQAPPPGYQQMGMRPQMGQGFGGGGFGGWGGPQGQPPPMGYPQQPPVTGPMPPGTAPMPGVGGGREGKRGRGDGDDGRDRRRPDKPKPLDKISMADFGPEGRLRQLVLLLLQTANLGNLPSGGLLTRGGQAKTLTERTKAVRRWVDVYLSAPNGQMQARYSELAESFVHVLRAVNAAGMYDQLVAMLVELLTNRAVELSEDE